MNEELLNKLRVVELDQSTGNEIPIPDMPHSNLVNEEVTDQFRKPPKTPPIDLMQTNALLVCTPAYGASVKTKFNQSSINLLLAAQRRNIPMVFCQVDDDSCLPRVRARLIHQFLKSNASHMVFIDADMGFAPDDVLDMMSLNKGVVACVGPQKRINWEKVIAAVKENPSITVEEVRRAGATMVVNWLNGGKDVPFDGQCAEVLDLGTGCMMIDKLTAQKMASHYVNMRFKGVGQDAGEMIVAMFENMIDDDGRYLTEDFAFCRRWQQIGGKVWAYLQMNMTHIGDFTYEGHIADQIAGVAA